MTRSAAHVRGARARRLATRLLTTGGPGPGFYGATPVDHDEAAAVDVVDASVFSTLQAGGVPEKLSRTKKYAFKISAIKDSCPWYDRAYAVWSRRLRSSLSAQYAIACRLNDTELSTMSNYRGKWNVVYLV